MVIIPIRVVPARDIGSIHQHNGVGNGGGVSRAARAEATRIALRGPADVKGDIFRIVVDVDTFAEVRERRSEEHTSELQSQFHLVCRLLLEKKKKNNRQQNSTYKISSIA